MINRQASFVIPEAPLETLHAKELDFTSEAFRHRRFNIE
jgi:hypothetical protein